MAVCPFCRTAVSRKGIDLEAIGKVAELVPTSSPFQLRMSAHPRKGIKPFDIVGRLQLSTGTGTWDEWFLNFNDGSAGWLAEAQGSFYLMTPMPPPEAPEFEAIQPGQRLELRPYGLFTVDERREATYSSASGELPFTSPPGSLFRYADLSGADGSLATLDYGADPGLDDFYVGRKIELAELGIQGLTAWSDRKVSAQARSLNCPNCGGAIDMRDPQKSVRITCGSCGSLLGTGKADNAKFEVLKKLKAVPFEPLIPLGSKGSLNEHPYVVLGAVRKSCVSDGTTYYWTEYLLKETKSEAYHWLVESNGHWSLVLPIPAASTEEGPRMAAYEGRRYRQFQVAKATVFAVLGEFYWSVASRDTSLVSDFVAPPRILSKEVDLDGNEVNWTEGSYVPKASLEGAFALKSPLPDPEGVGSNQPWPLAEEAPYIRGAAGILALSAILLFILFSIRAPKAIVFEKEFPLDAAGTDSSSTDVSAQTPQETGLAAARRPPEVILTDPFPISHRGNLQVTLEAPSDNTWVGVGASLINQESGDVRSFGLLSDYYHGVDDGESWSEGNRSRTVFLSQIEPGSYVLRMEPEFEKGKAPPHFHIRLRSGVPRNWHLVLALFLIGIGPLALGFSKIRFEGRRWAESDLGEDSDEDSGGGSSSDTSDSSSDD